MLVGVAPHVFDVVPTDAGAGWAAGSGLGCLFAPLDDADAVAYPVGAWTAWLQVRSAEGREGEGSVPCLRGA